MSHLRKYPAHVRQFRDRFEERRRTTIVKAFIDVMTMARHSQASVVR